MARRRQPISTLGVVGWLFAELALLLMIVALGSEERPPAAEPPAPPASSAPVPTTTAPRPAAPEGMLVTTETFTMHVNPSGEGVVDEFRRNLDAKAGANGRVGLVLLFGRSRDPSAPTQGTLVSGQLKDLVQAAGLPQLRTMNDMRAYLGSEGRPGDVEVELFLLNGGS